MDASFRLLFFVCFILLTIKMKITCHPQKHYLQNENSLRANTFIFAIQNNMWQSRDKYSRNKYINPMWVFFLLLPSSTQFHLLDFNYYHNLYSFIRHKQKGSQTEPLTSLGNSL